MIVPVSLPLEPPVMRGSVVIIGTRNKQPYFSLNKNKKTQLICQGQKRGDKAREYSQNYKKFLEIVEEMTIINMALLKENACLQHEKMLETL